jgi:hypothetical protein
VRCSRLTFAVPQVKLWDTGSASLVTAIEGHESWIMRLAFSDDGSCARTPLPLSLSLFPIVSWRAALWSAQAAPTNQPTTSSGTYLFSGGQDGSVVVWDVRRPARMLGKFSSDDVAIHAPCVGHMPVHKGAVSGALRLRLG